jgi:hypothetical protein
VPVPAQWQWAKVLSVAAEQIKRVDDKLVLPPAPHGVRKLGAPPSVAEETELRVNHPGTAGNGFQRLGLVRAGHLHSLVERGHGLYHCRPKFRFSAVMSIVEKRVTFLKY